MEIFNKLRALLFIRPLIKLKNNLLMSTTSNRKFYEKYIRWQLVSTIEYLIYGEKNWKNTLKAVWKNKFLILLFILVTSSVILAYKIGGYSRDGEVSALIDSNITKKEIINHKNNIILHNKSLVNEKNNKIDNLQKFKESREWLEFKIYRESKIDKFDLKMSRVSDDILFLMAEQADKYKIPYSIYFRLIDVESGYKFIANNSGSGAFGYMQVMPVTFNSYYNKLGLTGGHTKQNNIYVGSYMLYKDHESWVKRGFDNRTAWKYTLAEYNAGEGTMQKKDSNGKVTGWFIPNCTKNYISKIMKYYNKNKS